MVRKIFKFFAYMLFFLTALIYFTPKVNLYYLLESKLKEKSVVITDEVLHDNGLSLSIDDASVNLKSIESAKIKEINIKVLGLYNSVNFTDVSLASVAATMVPTEVQSISISYTIFDLLHLVASAVGDFGDAQLKFGVLDGVLHIELHPSKKMLSSYRQTLRDLKKSKEGAYTYDKTFKF